ncbi:hypothetical protein T02_10801 [Trichinella nativa]|uniref:Uncharacterized protein n=1 Tax=Trichinella nativa TaxID=6335 RepID=A0A0V1LS24_9BILA|nr:hypothetical protein T02_10801 [Trichinella nativa]
MSVAINTVPHLWGFLISAVLFSAKNTDGYILPNLQIYKTQVHPTNSNGKIHGICDANTRANLSTMEKPERALRQHAYDGTVSPWHKILLYFAPLIKLRNENINALINCGDLLKIIPIERKADIIKSEKRVQEFQIDTTMNIQLSLAINTFFEEINILDRNDNYNLKLLAKEREDKINE